MDSLDSLISTVEVTLLLQTKEKNEELKSYIDYSVSIL